MELLSKDPAMFWFNFIFWFLFCTGVQSFIQIQFLVKFSKIRPKKHYYFIFIGLSYLSYILGLIIPVKPGLITQILIIMFGAFIIFIFSIKVLKQNYSTSTILSVLLVTINVLVESFLAPLLFISINLLKVQYIIIEICFSLIVMPLTYGLTYFFYKIYNIKSSIRSKYLLVLAIPLIFISTVMRILIEYKYSPPGANNMMISRITMEQNYEFLGLTIFSFICICGMLFAYEKLIFYFETENKTQILKNYVYEAKARHDTTRVFRHDFKNHLIALNGLLEKNETAKAKQYIKRFESISDYISFPVNTGNIVLDSILSEKLSYAKSSNINVSCDIIVPHSFPIDDFDLCVIFSNSIDNAINACTNMISSQRQLTLIAKPLKNFFIINLTNTFEAKRFSKGSGLGITSIKTTIDKYNGVLEISTENNVFNLSVLIPY